MFTKNVKPGKIQASSVSAREIYKRCSHVPLNYRWENKQTTLERTQKQDYLIKPTTFSFIILLFFPDQVSGPPLLELHGVRSRSRELRRHLISRRHILPPKAEASGFFQRKKTFRNLKITSQVLRYMSENLSQLTGVVKKIKIDLWIPISNFQAHLSFCGWTPVNWSLFSTQTSRSTCQSQR